MRLEAEPLYCKKCGRVIDGNLLDCKRCSPLIDRNAIFKVRHKKERVLPSLYGESTPMMIQKRESDEAGYQL